MRRVFLQAATGAALAALLALSGCATSPALTAEQQAELATWTRAAHAKIRANSYYPRDPAVAAPLMEGTARVRISVARDGAVYTPQIERSSGEPLFDAAALAIVLRSAPLPPPPAFMIEEGNVAKVLLPINFKPQRPVVLN